ncbi:MAG: DUF1553 domain-containing protein [Pirellulaceae bacterium]|nr:DUF1553 domain-containing protein [Pirellulaceae bacterium]
MRTHPFFVLALLLTAATGPIRSAVADDKSAEVRSDKNVAFFEEKIRPLLVEHCYECHSAEAQSKKRLKGGLLLDSEEGWRTGGDSGPAIVAHHPDESLLIQALRYSDEVQMPPQGQLPAPIVADFEAWVRRGAADPRGGAASVTKQVGLTIEQGRQFWAYQLPRQHPVPHVDDPRWQRTEIDRFIGAALAARGLEPAGRADRETLVRRVYFGLLGLPPTVAEMDSFLSDPNDDAYERLVDQLLARPEFGERWGRHWLDIVRYADSVTLRGLVFREAWRYRDYVIDSFNSDLPFDRFIREQIAGDLLPADDSEDRRRLLTATTMLLLGNANLENQDKNLLRLDVVDEQLDVIGKGFLAQTVTCARCHDHKFDPIPTTDYYALAGILRNTKALEHANVSKWMEVPLPVAPEVEAEWNRHQANVERLTARIKQLKARTETVRAGDRGPLDPADIAGVVVDDDQAKRVGTWQHSVYTGSYISRGYLHDQNTGKGEKTLTFEPQDLPPGRYEVRLAYAEGSGRARAVPVTVFSADGDTVVEVDMQPRGPIDGRYVSLGQYHFEANGQAHVMISNEGTQGHVTADAVVFVPLEPTPQSPAAAVAEAKSATSEAINEAASELARLEAELKQLQAAAPKREMVMAVVEEAKIEDLRVHLRGSPSNLGDVAPRGFLQVAVYGDPPSIPADQSGRKELADWIASPQNPLTARVIVNRVWHWLLGAGIVRTTDNFGVSGQRPSHPELLDQLALQFMQEGWSIKRLVRRIVLTETYQQASQAVPATKSADPDNRLFGRANRRRLEAEAIRDGILQISGRLSPERGGRHFPPTLAADFAFATDATVRSVYLPYFRNSLPDLIAAFDPADPSTTTGQRDASTIAPQALFMLNHPFVAQQAQAAAERLLEDGQEELDHQIVRVYRQTLGRRPTEAEAAIARKHLDAHSNDPRQGWAALYHALFASAEFRLIH